MAIKKKLLIITSIFIISSGIFYYTNSYESPKEKDNINKLVNEFLEIEKIAARTPRIVLPNIVKNLVQLMINIENTKTSKSCDILKESILKDTDLIITNYTNFMAEKENELEANWHYYAIERLNEISKFESCKDYTNHKNRIEKESNKLINEHDKLINEHKKKVKKTIFQYINKLKNKTEYSIEDIQLTKEEKELLFVIGYDFLKDVEQLEKEFKTAQNYALKNDSTYLNTEQICINENRIKINQLISEGHKFLSKENLIAKPFKELINNTINQIEVKFSKIIKEPYTEPKVEYVITNNSPYTINTLYLKNDKYNHFDFLTNFSFYRQNSDREEFSGLPPHSSIKVIVKNLFDVHESVYAGDKLRQYRELKKDPNFLITKTNFEYYGNDSFIVYKTLTPSKIHFSIDNSKLSVAPISKKIEYSTKCDYYYSLSSEEELKKYPSDGSLTCWNLKNKNKSIDLKNYQCNLEEETCSKEIADDYFKNKEIFGEQFENDYLNNNSEYISLKEKIKKEYSQIFNTTTNISTDNISIQTNNGVTNILIHEEDIDMKYQQTCYKKTIADLINNFLSKYKDIE